MKKKTRRNRKPKLMRSAALVMAAGLVFGAPAAAVMMPNAGIEVQAADYDTTSLSDWTYTQDSSAKTVTLTAYNGTSTAVQIPASFDIDGTTYTTTLAAGASNGAAGLNTGTITNLAFATGFVMPASCDNLFAHDSALTSIDFTGVDTSGVTSMDGMFFCCTGLTSLDLSSFNTSNVTDMGMMFCGCSGLTSLDVSSFDTNNVTDMGSMFSGCSGLTSLDLSTFDTSSVTDMGAMFDSCSSLTSLNMTGWDTSSVTSMIWMFYGCSGLTSIDVSGFNTSKVTAMSGMFRGCSGLTTVDVSNFDTSNVTYLLQMFKDCSGLTSIEGLENFVTTSATRMDKMFSGCTGLTSIDVSSFDTSSVTTLQETFYNCSALTTLDLSGFDVSNVSTFADMVTNDTALTKIYTPKTAVSSTSTLPATFYLADSDGVATADSESYTDLMAAPVSSLITTVLSTSGDTTSGDDTTDDSSFSNTAASGGAVTFKKCFVVDSEASVPSETFNFTIAPGTAQSYDVANQHFEVLAGVGTPTIGTATFSSSDTTSTTAADGDGVTLSDGQAYAVTTVSVDFSGVSFDEPGVYRYVITETNDGAKGVTYDSANVRYLDVYVTSDDNGALSVESYVLHTSDSTIAMNSTSGTGDVTTDGDAVSDKSYGFVNSYTSHDLTIASEVAGNQAAKDKYFAITVSLSNAAPDSTLPIELTSADATTASNASTVTANRNQINPTSITIGSDGTGSATLYLSADQSVRIDGLTDGTAYTVTADTEDYTPSIEVTGDISIASTTSDTTTNVSAADLMGLTTAAADDSTTVSSATVSDTSLTADTTLTITATRQGAVPTGIILPILPYVIAAGVAGAGIALTAKKKHENA